MMQRKFLSAATIAIALTTYAAPAKALIINSTALTDAGEPGTDYIPSLTFNLNAPLAPAKATVSLLPVLPLGITSFTAAAQATYNAEKATQFPNWTVALGSAADLHGGLVIDKYQARRGTAMNEGVGNAAGALFQAHYNRATNDPANLTWLQFYTDNTGAGGALVSHIDPFPNDDTREKMPFYWRDNEAGEKLTDPFSDRPSDGITSVPFFRSVDFQLYLVGYDPAQVNDGVQGGNITVYGGVKWGYRIVAAPEPGSAIIFPTMLVLLVVTYRRSNQRNNREC